MTRTRRWRLGRRPPPPDHVRRVRQQVLLLRAVASAPDSPWSWGLEWRRLRQAASRAVPVSLGGAVVPGISVLQPEVSMRDFGLTVSRRF